jgi:hypothetical protein
MNPLLIATAAKTVSNGMENGAIPDMVNNASNNIAKNIRIALLIGLSIVIVFIAWRLSKKWREKLNKEQFNNLNMHINPSQTLAKTYANRIKASFGFFNDKEDEIYHVGEEMKKNNVSFSDVAKAYKQGYNKDLQQELQKRLDATELRKFYMYAGLNGILDFFNKKNELEFISY